LPEALDDRILSLLQNSKEGSMLQGALLKVLDIGSKELIKSLTKLQKQGIVKRQPFKDGGRRTYKIILLKKEAKVDLKDVTWTSCLICPDLERCGKGQPISPETCNKLTAAVRAEFSKLLTLGEIKDAQ
jgi:DNA-binding MarR family transcriptional regulator